MIGSSNAPQSNTKCNVDFNSLFVFDKSTTIENVDIVDTYFMWNSNTPLHIAETSTKNLYRIGYINIEDIPQIERYNYIIFRNYYKQYVSGEGYVGSYGNYMCWAIYDIKNDYVECACSTYNNSDNAQTGRVYKTNFLFRIRYSSSYAEYYIKRLNNQFIIYSTSTDGSFVPKCIEMTLV